MLTWTHGKKLADRRHLGPQSSRAVSALPRHAELVFLFDAAQQVPLVV